MIVRFVPSVQSVTCDTDFATEFATQRNQQLLKEVMVTFPDLVHWLPPTLLYIQTHLAAVRRHVGA